MGIYLWDNQARLDIRKQAGAVEAVIYPKPGESIDSIIKYAKNLEAKGAKVNAFYLPPVVKHDLTIKNIPQQDLEELAKKLGEFTKDKSAEVTLHGDHLDIKGLQSDTEVDAFIRWISKRVAKHPVEFKHTPKPEPLQQGIFIRSEGNEEALIQDLEAQGYGTGTRKDEFHGMNPFSKAWAKIVRDANKFAPLLYMTGDTQVIAANWLDANRRGIKPWEHEAFAEGIGFFAGSSLWLSNTLLNEPSSVASLTDRFLGTFKSGDTYDFGRAGGFTPHGNSDGRGPESLKGLVRGSGLEMHMLLNTWASTGLLRAGKGKIIATDTADGLQNVALDEVTGARGATERNLYKNPISGALLLAATLIMAFVPRKGTVQPFVDYASFGDKLQSVPVLGNVMRAADDFFTNNPVGQNLSRPFTFVADWLTGDPYKIASRLVMAHNVQQIGFNIADLRARTGEEKKLVEQFHKEAAQLEASLHNPAVPLPAAKAGVEADFKGAELVRVQQALGKIYNLDNKAIIAEPRYKEGTPEYAAKFSAPETYLDYIQIHEARLKQKDYVPSAADEHIYIKALNRLYLDELAQEIKTIKFKFGGYGIMSVASFLLGHSGEQFKDLVNGAEAGVNPFAAAESVVAQLKEHGTPSEQAIRNAAAFLHQDVATQKFGLSVQDYVELLTAKVEGRRTALEEQLLSSSGLESKLSLSEQLEHTSKASNDLVATPDDQMLAGQIKNSAEAKIHENEAAARG